MVFADIVQLQILPRVRRIINILLIGIIFTILAGFTRVENEFLLRKLLVFYLFHSLLFNRGIVVREG